MLTRKRIWIGSAISWPLLTVTMCWFDPHLDSKEVLAAASLSLFVVGYFALNLFYVIWLGEEQAERETVRRNADAFRNGR
jgi:hypothetical protein